MTSMKDNGKSIYEQKRDETIAMAIPSKSEELDLAICNARKSLKYFRKAIIAQKYPSNSFYLKTYITDNDGDKGIHLWLIVVKLQEDGYICKPFEIPQNFNGLTMNDAFLLKDDFIEDWMIRVSGELFGGYSIRLMRAHTPQNEQQKFDEFIGIEKYSDQMP